MYVHKYVMFLRYVYKCNYTRTLTCTLLAHATICNVGSIIDGFTNVIVSKTAWVECGRITGHSTGSYCQSTTCATLITRICHSSWKLELSTTSCKQYYNKNITS